jgi:hypothetical protein
VLLAGKRSCRGQLNALAPGLLLRITCVASQRRYLVDTGAAFSVLPYKGTKQLSPDLPRLRAAGGQVIPCYGELRVNIQFDERIFDWTLLLADVESPLLRADFLREYRLLVDLHGGCLIDAATRQRCSSTAIPLRRRRPAPVCAAC